MKWISVKDRLPEDKKIVLVLDKGGIITDSYYNQEGKYFPYCGGCRPDDFSVTHWMPLPELPEKQEGEVFYSVNPEAKAIYNQLRQEELDSLPPQEKDRIIALEKELNAKFDEFGFEDFSGTTKTKRESRRLEKEFWRLFVAFENERRATISKFGKILIGKNSG